MLAKLPDRYFMLGEEIEPYLVFSNTHDGSGAIRVCLTPVRIVCQNTLNLALKSAKRAWSTVHVGDLSKKMDEAHCTLSLAHDYMGKLGEEFYKLNQIKLSDAKVVEYIETLLPMMDNPTDTHRNNITKIREDAKTRYFEAPDLRNLEKSAYRFVNAISDFATHAKPLRETVNYRENVFAKTVDGHPMIDKAYELVLAA
jgi:hypothetical protein